nr:ankyrin repeat domain-containing protein 13B-like [Danaus plexippus plexippus]
MYIALSVYRTSGMFTPSKDLNLSHLYHGPQEDTPRRSRSREELRPVSWEEYFGEGDERELRPRDVTTKVQKFRATLWLCEDYPLQLQEQIMPILDLMAAISSPHFAKLKDFVQMQLPAGFPVKIEIPLFHVLNARITFGNIFATETPVEHDIYIYN